MDLQLPLNQVIEYLSLEMNSDKPYVDGPKSGISKQKPPLEEGEAGELAAGRAILEEYLRSQGFGDWAGMSEKEPCKGADDDIHAPRDLDGNIHEFTPETAVVKASSDMVELPGSASPSAKAQQAPADKRVNLADGRSEPEFDLGYLPGELQPHAISTASNMGPCGPGVNKGALPGGATS